MIFQICSNNVNRRKISHSFVVNPSLVEHKRLTLLTVQFSYCILEIVITRAAPAFHKLFMVMGCVFDINTVHIRPLKN